MSIMFRCPCGRTMVAESDRAGAIVTCPNCKRSLKVPTGKERGVELAPVPAAAKTRMSRQCKRCGKDIPVDSQICPHCKAIQIEAAAPAAPAAPAKRPAAIGRTAPAARAPTGVLLGGYRGSWYTRLTPGGKAGVLIGIGAFIILSGIIVYVLATTYWESELQKARDDGQRALAQGRKDEDEGKFQDAYERYSFTDMKRRLHGSALPKDRELADTLDARYFALSYLAPQPHSRESVRWKAQTQEEYNAAMAHCKETYPAYRALAQAVADAGLEAIQVGLTNANRTVFDEKVARAVDAFVQLISKTDDQQRALITFGQLREAIKQLGYANQTWGQPKHREQCLLNAKSRFEGMKELAARPGGDVVE